VEASRGCPYGCAFCRSAVKLVQGEPEKPAAGPVREFPLETFFSNFDALLQHCRKSTAKMHTIKFLDRSFNINLPRTLRILQFCLAKTLEIKTGDENWFQFHFEMVPGVFSPELGKLLALFPPGAIRLEIGIQSFNPLSCSLIHRISNPEKELELLRFLREETHAILHVDLIAGLPGEDLASFGRGFDRLWIILSSRELFNSAPFEIQPGLLKVLPGTPIYEMAELDSFNVRFNKSAPYEVIETNLFSVNDMERIKNFARFWESLVNQGKFPGMLPFLAPPGVPVFDRFMELSQKLTDRFGRSWGIPKQELEAYLEGIAR
jgi:radical SAM superfamily enzyme YgiQ (UPF0313 family)